MGFRALNITAVAAAGIICAGLFSPAYVQAKEVADKGDFKYVISEDGKSAEIVSYVGQSLYVSVPTEIDKCVVTSIGPAAFKNNEKLKELEIAGTIKSIDTAAFSGCTSLHKVHIAGAVRTIGQSAFSGCTALKELSIDDGLEKIDKFAFSECSALESVVLPNSVDHIGDYAFINCKELKKPQFPKNLRYFGGYALENTKWMESQKGDFVVIGDGILVKYIGKADIKSIPKTIKTIGSYSFAGNKVIKNIMIPSSVSVIETSAFEGCEKLSDVYMPASVERIGQRAFFGCKALKKLDLTDRLTLIDSYSFASTGLTEVTIPKNVSVINEGAFDHCQALASVNFGSGVKKIASYAFRDCINLKKLVFPNNVKEIEKDAFAGCKTLLRAEFNGDTKLNESAFNECPNMNAAVFYHNPKVIEDNAFNQIPELVIYSDNNLYLDEYAERNSKTSDNLKNLPAYNERITHHDEGEEHSEFSLGYTLITVLIILIDITVIALFAFYLTVDNRRVRAKSLRDERRYAERYGNPVQGHSRTDNSRVRTRQPAAASSETGEVTFARSAPRRKTVRRRESDDEMVYVDSTSASRTRAARPERPVSKQASSSRKRVTPPAAPTERRRPQTRKPVQQPGTTSRSAAVPQRRQPPADAPIPQRKRMPAERRPAARQVQDSHRSSALKNGDTMIFRKPPKK